MANQLPSVARGMKTKKGGSPMHFLRVLGYSKAYRRYLIPAILCIVMVAMTYSINIAALLPIIEGITGVDGLPTWIREAIVAERLGLQLGTAKIGQSESELLKGGSGVRVLRINDEEIVGDRLSPEDRIIGIGDQQVDRAELLKQLAEWPDEGSNEKHVVLLVLTPNEAAPKRVEITPAPVSRAFRLARDVANRLPQEATPSDRLSTLTVIVVVVLIIAMIGAASRFGGEYLIALVAARTVIAIRRQMYRKVLRLPTAHFAQHGTSDIISRFVQDSQDIYRGLNFVFAKGVREPLKAIFVFAFAIYLDPKITLVTVIAAPFAALLIRKLGKLIRKANKRMLEGYGRMLGALEGALSGIRVVKGYGMESYERRHLFAIDMAILKQQLRIARIEAVSSPIFETVGRIVASIAILYFANLMFEGDMNFSKFAAMAGAMAAIFDPIRKMSNMYNRVQRANAAAERVFEVLALREEEPDAAAKSALPLISKSIEFRNIRFTYPGAEIPALDEISLTVKSGERVAFVGPNGSGKTTLLSMLMRFFEPDEGAILVDGRDVREFTISSLRQQMSLITQDTIMFADTIANNIAYADDELIRRLALQRRHPDRNYVNESQHQRIVDAARAAYADEFIREKPQQYETLIGEHGANLSGGQKQRIAIARAFLRNAPIFIFDEATSQVDMESEQKIHDAVEKFLKGRTAFIIAHRLSTILQADRIAVMDRGRIIDIGRHDDLVKRCGVYRSLFGATDTDPSPEHRVRK
ncbi:MAG: ABC transporter ATP-binding protein [Planctomycetota bacterium]|nr:ABC transporter ATP-binding protein [Planctomycetota bacterium]